MPSFARWVLTAVFPLLGLCLARSTIGTQAATATTSISHTIPTCASSCLIEFIETDYPASSCPNRENLDCLCRTNTTSGYTLGEAALRCALSYCPQDVTLGSDVYDVCDSVAGALPNTHATITATVMSKVTPTTAMTQTTDTGSVFSTTDSRPQATSTSTTFSSSSTSSSPSTSTSTSTSSSTSISTFAFVTSFIPPLSITSTTSTSSTTINQPTLESATPSETAQPSHHLNAGAVIGVSVASGVSGFFIIGVGLFFCCRRIRRKHQDAKDRNFFEIGGVMSEPPDFHAPSRRLPSPGPKPPPGRAYRDPEMARLMSPFSPRPNPPVIVTGPDDHESLLDFERPERIGFAISSESEFGDSSRSLSSHRTISDLLPDKPTYGQHNGLYPEPLRWSRQKYTNPPRGPLAFDEHGQSHRGYYGPSNGFPNFSSFTDSGNGGREYTQMRTAGLPANPRALIYGLEGAQRFLPAKKTQPPLPMKPVYINGEDTIHSSREAAICGSQASQSTHRQSLEPDYVDDYWKNSSIRVVGQTSPRSKNRRSVHGSAVDNRPSEEDSDTSFETVDINENSGSSSAGLRHSGNFKPLSPLREVRTPSGGSLRNGRDHINGSPPVLYPRVPDTVTSVREIVSRPRIVRRDDIKRVQIRRGKPQPKELTMPYSPDDYWTDPSSSSSVQDVSQTSPKRPAGPRSPTKTTASQKAGRQSPLEHNLTPSRRGTDLILRVD